MPPAQDPPVQTLIPRAVRPQQQPPPSAADAPTSSAGEAPAAPTRRRFRVVAARLRQPAAASPGAPDAPDTIADLQLRAVRLLASTSALASPSTLPQQQNQQSYEDQLDQRHQYQQNQNHQNQNRINPSLSTKSASSILSQDPEAVLASLRRRFGLESRPPSPTPARPASQSSPPAPQTHPMPLSPYAHPPASASLYDRAPYIPNPNHPPILPQFDARTRHASTNSTSNWSHSAAFDMAVMTVPDDPKPLPINLSSQDPLHNQTQRAWASPSPINPSSRASIVSDSRLDHLNPATSSTSIPAPIAIAQAAPTNILAQPESNIKKMIERIVESVVRRQSHADALSSALDQVSLTSAVSLPSPSHRSTVTAVPPKLPQQHTSSPPSPPTLQQKKTHLDSGSQPSTPLHQANPQEPTTAQQHAAVTAVESAPAMCPSIRTSPDHFRGRSPELTLEQLEPVSPEAPHHKLLSPLPPPPPPSMTQKAAMCDASTNTMRELVPAKIESSTDTSGLVQTVATATQTQSSNHPNVANKSTETDEPPKRVGIDASTQCTPSPPPETRTTSTQHYHAIMHTDTATQYDCQETRDVTTQTSTTEHEDTSPNQSPTSSCGPLYHIMLGPASPRYSQVMDQITNQKIDHVMCHDTNSLRDADITVPNLGQSIRFGSPIHDHHSTHSAHVLKSPYTPSTTSVYSSLTEPHADPVIVYLREQIRAVYAELDVINHEINEYGHTRR